MDVRVKTIKKAESWRIDAFELWCRRRPESPLDCKEIQPVHPKGNHPWILIGRTDAESEALILWPPDVKSWLIGKDPNAGKDWGQKEKRVAEDEMVGQHHWFSGHESKQILGDSGGQRSLACSMVYKELDRTQRLNNNKRVKKGLEDWSPQD